MVTFQFVPYREIDNLSSTKRITKLLDVVKQNKIVIMDVMQQLSQIKTSNKLIIKTSIKENVRLKLSRRITKKGNN